MYMYYIHSAAQMPYMQLFLLVKHCQKITHHICSKSL